MLAPWLLLSASMGVVAATAPPGPAATPAATPSAAPPSEAILRRLVAETAAAQLIRLDPAWPEPQRDCAGLVRFAYRTAFKRLDPARAAAGPFQDAAGRRAHFADAATLLAGTFVPMGRDEAARARLRSGDLLAFAREDEGGEPVHHLMLVLRPDDPAQQPALVLYHPGEPGAAVRSGRLDDLLSHAPPGWRPVPENPLFLGFYRLKEWTP
jgi:uncharacterized protein YfaT (DUF1175 family)